MIRLLEGGQACALDRLVRDEWSIVTMTALASNLEKL